MTGPRSISLTAPNRGLTSAARQSAQSPYLWSRVAALTLAACLVALVSITFLTQSAEGQPPVRRSRARAPLPKWDNLPSIFFTDAFSEALRGQRPGGTGVRTDGEARRPSAEGTDTSTSRSRESSGTHGQSGWSAVVSSSALEDEVKRLSQRLGEWLVSLAQYRAEHHQSARDDLSLLTTTLSVIAQYDGEVRWKESAAGLAAICQRAVVAANEPSAASYAAAQLALEAVRGAIQGDTLQDLPAGESVEDWSTVADRTVLMRRLELSETERLTPSSNTAAATRLDASGREAELIGMVARILVAPGMDNADDADYVALAARLERAAAEAALAAARQESESFSSAAEAIRRTCTDCHESYR